jgi:hypothetical protein
MAELDAVDALSVEAGFTVNQDNYQSEPVTSFEDDCRAEWRKEDEWRKYAAMRSEKAEQSYISLDRHHRSQEMPMWLRYTSVCGELILLAGILIALVLK